MSEEDKQRIKAYGKNRYDKVSKEHKQKLKEY